MTQINAILPLMGLFLPAPVSAEDADHIVGLKLRWILSACTPLEVWLFGSAATGEMTEASDIDLALLFGDE
ncbi:MAG: nucleotidyltransferase family protein, partial [Spirochaetota bacterium]